MKLLGKDGNPIQKTKTASAVFFMSLDGETWEPMRPKDVPEGLKDKDVLGYMMAGEIMESQDNVFYRVERVH